MIKESDQTIENDEDTIIRFITMPMNKNIFADTMKMQLWFNDSFMFGGIKGDNGDIKKIDFSKVTKRKKLSLNERFQLIFGKLFGGYGLERDLQSAKELAEKLLEYINKQKPKYDINNNDYFQWLHYWGQINVLLGTVYAYTDENIKSNYHLFAGAKTNVVLLNQTYNDFMRYMVKELAKLPKEKAGFDNYGFEKDLPMGYISSGDCVLQSKTALKIIAELENANGYVVPAIYDSRGVLGYLKRIGSTITKNSNFNCDIYETYLINEQYNLKTINFYFNGYSSQKEEKPKIVLPKKFFIEEHSWLNTTFDFIKGTDVVVNRCLICGKSSDGCYCTECNSKQKMMMSIPIF